MKIYKIYSDSQKNYVAVKQGWSWSAFWLTFLWAMVKKIWSMSTVSLGFFLVFAVSTLVASAITPEVAMRLSFDLLFIYVGYLLLGFSLLMGLNGHQWQERSLVSRRYRYQEMLVADNANAAIVLYVKQHDENDLLVA